MARPSLRETVMRVSAHVQPTRESKEDPIMKTRNIVITCLAILTAVVVVLATGQPRQAHAITGWDWWDAIDDQHNHKAACPDPPPTKTQWENALGEADDPHWTELTVFFIAYPCSNPPSSFIEYRDWLNWEIHDEGTYDEAWEGYKFFDLKNLVNELNESPAGYWDDGPWT